MLSIGSRMTSFSMKRLLVLAPLTGLLLLLPVGGSRAGGEPDLASDDTDWPEGHSFLLQVDLAEIAAHDIDAKLPHAGLLSFFVIDGEDDDGDYLSTGHVQFHEGGKGDLEHVKAPREDGIKRYPARGLRFAPVLTLPHSDSKGYLKLRLTDAEHTAYHDSIYRDTPAPHFQLLGCDNTDQNDAEADNEQLLLSLGSVDEMRWNWGEGHRLNFYIPLSDLAEGDLDEGYPQLIDA